MARKGSETARLERDLGKLVDSIELSDHQEHFIRARWLDQISGWKARRSSASAATTRFVWSLSSAV